MALELRPAVAQEMQPSVLLLAHAELLALTSMELERRIGDEVAANPALDAGQPDTGWWSAGAAEERRDAIEAVADRPGLVDRLLGHARFVLDGADLLVAEWLAGSLDASGFLDASPDEVREALGVEREAVDRALAALREAGPVAIGARDLRECLLLQLAQLARDGGGHPIAAAIVADHLEDLAAGRLTTIARALGVRPADVAGAHDFIRRRLCPRPADLDADAGAPEPRPRPDVAVREGEDGALEVDVLEPRLPCVDGLYRRLAGAAGAAVDEDARAHARHHVRRAEAFLRLLERRTRTLQRLFEHVANRQAAFVRHGPRSLVPLTRAQVAGDLGIHESTVSRAVAGKLVLLPSGAVVPAGRFFRSALAVEDVLRDLAGADGRAMSDRELGERLRALGHPVARRTVAKYRARLGIGTRARR